jgi:hypothetical protein
MRHRLIAAALPAVLLLAACGPRAGVSVKSSHSPAGAYRIFLQEGFNGGARQVTVVNSMTGAVERQLPLGTPAPDWSRYYIVERGTTNGTLKAIEPSSGQTLAQTSIPGGFFLPDLTGLGPTAGLSPNGRWLTLTRQLFEQHGTTTSVLIGDSSLSQPFKHIELTGDFSFDALSNDGKSLYLIEKMQDANHYRVRLYNMADHSLMPGAVVDKREPNEPMNGIRGSSLAAPGGGHVYTVYLRDQGPFIHALSLSDPFAFCVDLPSKGASDLERQSAWSLAISGDGSRLYAVNGLLGTVSVFTTGDPPKVVRTATLPPSPVGLSSPFTLNAEAKGQIFGGAAVSGDGRTLFAVGARGVLALDAQSLQTRSAWVKDWWFDSIHMSSDGNVLFAASLDGSLLGVNPATGAMEGVVPGVNQPWAVLWAEPE